MPADFKPKKVVFAILMKNGKQLSPDTLFPFSQATLAHAARVLSTYGMTSRSSASRPRKAEAVNAGHKT